jgi:hypothetical protein
VRARLRILIIGAAAAARRAQKGAGGAWGGFDDGKYHGGAWTLSRAQWSPLAASQVPEPRPLETGDMSADCSNKQESVHWGILGRSNHHHLEQSRARRGKCVLVPHGDNMPRALLPCQNGAGGVLSCLLLSGGSGLSHGLRQPRRHASNSGGRNSKESRETDAK